jgi:hypothetical protein
MNGIYVRPIEAAVVKINNVLDESIIDTSFLHMADVKIKLSVLFMSIPISYCSSRVQVWWTFFQM